MVETWDDQVKRRRREGWEECRAAAVAVFGSLGVAFGLCALAGFLGGPSSKSIEHQRLKESSIVNERLLRDFYVPNPAYFSYDEPQMYLAQKSSSL